LHGIPLRLRSRGSRVRIFW